MTIFSIRVVLPIPVLPIKYICRLRSSVLMPKGTSRFRKLVLANKVIVSFFSICLYFFYGQVRWRSYFLAFHSINLGRRQAAFRHKREMKQGCHFFSRKQKFWAANVDAAV